MKDKKILYPIIGLCLAGIFFSLVALFHDSSFSDVPGAIVGGEKRFWIWITTSNLCFVGFIISLYFLGQKEEKEPEKKKA
jgi:hypothetical protein